jgi:hypothetical protein
MRTIKGWDYRIDKAVERTTKEWKQELADVIKRGGFRRFDNGETFGQLPFKGTRVPGLGIQFEIYGRVA